MIEKWVKSPFIFLTIFIFYFIGLWGLSIPMTGDQKVYLSIALEMREKSEWIVPYLFGAPNFLKPPLQYWVTLLGWNVFGFGTLGGLLPSLFALLGASFFTKKIVDHFYKKNGNLAALLFASSLGTMTYGTTAQMEIWIVVFYLAGWYYAILNRIFIAYLIVGAMSCVKGPLYPALWTASYILYSVLNQKYKNIFSVKFISAVFMGIAIGLLWYGIAARTHYPEVYGIFFQQENVAKIGGNHGTPASLWGEFLYSLLPWALFFLVGLYGRSKNHWKFYLSYFLAPALFFTFFPYRVNTYLFILTPIAAMMVAEVGVQFSKIQLSILKIAGTAVGLSLMFVLFRLAQGSWISFSIIIPLFAVVALWIWLHFRPNLYFLGLLSLCFVNLIRIGAVELGEHDAKDLRRYLDKEKGISLAYFIEDKDIWHEFGMMSAAVGIDIQRFYQIADVETFMNDGGTIILNDSQKERFSNGECESWFRFRRHLKFPIKELITHGVGRDDARFYREFKLCRKHRNIK